MLTVSGIKESELQDRLDQYCTNLGWEMLHISAILEPELLSISGPPKHLQAFKKQSVSKLATKPVDICCWYHGGRQLEAVIEKVVKDLDYRGVQFPALTDLKKCVRSTSDGSILKPQAKAGTTLAEWVIREILVNRVDWNSTVKEMSHTIIGTKQEDPRSETTLISFGPASRTLLSWTESIPSNEGIHVEDASNFRQARFPKQQNDSQQDIAIIGMGVNLPKGNGPDELWNTLSQGLTAVSEIPESRFKLSDYYSPNQGSKGRTMSARFGAFLDNIWNFDNSFFNISPREARSMDPQQRILLQTSQAALEDAGFVTDSTPSFQNASMGCYVGLATGDYTENLKDSIDVYYSPGGVNVICSPDMYLGLSRGHFLSSTGGCKTFDESADGYCRAEGSVMFVLKRLSDALREQDRVLGTIKGIELNHSGNSHSITHPHSDTQTALLSKLLAKSNIDSATVNVVEAHGTGTQAGDVCESRTLTGVFGSAHESNDPLLVGSIKGNIGHCEAASGAAGLAKLLLMLRKEGIPVQAGLTQLNPRLHGFTEGKLVVPRETTPWQTWGDAPRRALLNNFGAAGSNGALSLEEPPTLADSRDPTLQRSAYLFNISAKSAEALQRSVTAHQRFLDQHMSSLLLEDICYTATARREIYTHRLSLCCSSMQDLKDQLDKVCISESNPQRRDRGIGFVFSGQGAVHKGMGKELMKTSSFFRTIVQQCNTTLIDFGVPSVIDYLDDDITQDKVRSKNDETIITQCICVVLQYALARLLMSWGIMPQHLVGHSLGEYAALATSGALEIETVLYVVARRAQAMVKGCIPAASGMLACELSSTKAKEMLAGNPKFSHVNVACQNSNRDCVLAGPLDQLESFREVAKTQNVKSKLLEVPYGFRSQAMDPIVETLEQIGRSIRWSKPSIPTLSGVSGKWLQQDDCDDSYFARHARQPVLFMDCIDTLTRKGDSAEEIYVEIGPHPITLPMLRSHLGASSQPALATLRKGQPAWVSLVLLLSKLHELTESIDWRAVFADSDARMTDLPGYSLQYTNFEVQYHEDPTAHLDEPKRSEVMKDTGYKLLRKFTTSQSGDSTLSVETDMECLAPLISGHAVGGTTLCPASVFHELALEAGRIFLDPREDQVIVVEDLTFPNPLIYNPTEVDQPVHIAITKGDGRVLASFSITSNNAHGSREMLCSTGVLVLKDRLDLETRWKRHSAMIAKHTNYLSTGSSSNVSTFQTNVLYNHVFARVVQYSEDYQSIRSLNVSHNLEAIGTFQMRFGPKDSGYVVPPVFTDTLLHAAGFVANVHVPIETVCICSSVESVEVLYDQFEYDRAFTIYCTLYEAGQSPVIADAYAVDYHGHTVAIVCGMEFKKLKLASFRRHLQGGVSNDNPTPGESTTCAIQQSKPSISTNKSIENSPATKLSIAEIDGPPSGQDVEAKFKAIVAEVYGIAERTINKKIPLEALGINSLLHIELLSKFTEAFPTADLDQDRLTSCDTLMAMEVEIKSALSTPTNGSSSPADGESSSGLVGSPSTASSVSFTGMSSQPDATQIQKSASKQSPLYLFHDGSGQISMYRRVGNLERDVYAFPSSRQSTLDVKHKSLHDLAKDYVSFLNRAAGNQPMILAGWSFGGIVAFEAARQLLQAEISVQGLILIDAPLPIDHTPLPQELISYLFGRGKTGLDSGISSNRDVILAQFKYHTKLLAEHRAFPLDAELGHGLRTVILHSDNTLDTNKLCGVSYEWLNSEKMQKEVVQGWKTLVGKTVGVLTIPGNHFEAFDHKNITTLTSRLKEACRMLQD
ncbi:MAG: hypothetical protein Q9166_004188 [cf. Caloplaca sp. 2 TL-2023]